MKLFKLFQNTVVSLNLASSICVASFCLFYLIGGISLTNGTAVKTILVISSLYVEKHSFKINILSKRIPWNFTQFDRMLRMQIFCTYDELMGVQKFRSAAAWCQFYVHTPHSYSIWVDLNFEHYRVRRFRCPEYQGSVL